METPGPQGCARTEGRLLNETAVNSAAKALLLLQIARTRTPGSADVQVTYMTMTNAVTYFWQQFECSNVPASVFWDMPSLPDASSRGKRVSFKLVMARLCMVHMSAYKIETLPTRLQHHMNDQVCKKIDCTASVFVRAETHTLCNYALLLFATVKQSLLGPADSSCWVLNCCCCKRTGTHRTVHQQWRHL